MQNLHLLGIRSDQYELSRKAAQRFAVLTAVEQQQAGARASPRRIRRASVSSKDPRE